MKRSASLLGLVIAMAIGYFVYKVQLTQGPVSEAPPKQQIDVVGVQSDLLSIAQSERLYLVSNNSYATIEQLQQDGNLTFSGTNRRGFIFCG